MRFHLHYPDSAKYGVESHSTHIEQRYYHIRITIINLYPKSGIRRTSHTMILYNNSHIRLLHSRTRGRLNTFPCHRRVRHQYWTRNRICRGTVKHMHRGRLKGQKQTTKKTYIYTPESPKRKTRPTRTDKRNSTSIQLHKRTNGVTGMLISTQSVKTSQYHKSREVAKYPYNTMSTTIRVFSLH